MPVGAPMMMMAGAHHFCGFATHNAISCSCSCACSFSVANRLLELITVDVDIAIRLALMVVARCHKRAEELRSCRLMLMLLLMRATEQSEAHKSGTTFEHQDNLLVVQVRH